MKIDGAARAMYGENRPISIKGPIRMLTNAFSRSLIASCAALLLIGLAACSEEPPSDIEAATAIAAIRGGDDKAWDAVRSKKVRWSGSVVQVLMIHGDDFIKEYYLRFDPGFGADAVAEVPVDASASETYKPGRTVTVTAPVLRYEKENQTLVVKLGSGKVE